MIDPQGRLTIWLPSLYKFYIRVIYRAEFKNQVGDALSRCVPEDSDAGEVDDEIPIIRRAPCWSLGQK